MIRYFKLDTALDFRFKDDPTSQIFKSQGNKLPGGRLGK
jgi:hypothetical protein